MFMTWKYCAGTPVAAFARSDRAISDTKIIADDTSSVPFSPGQVLQPEQ